MDKKKKKILINVLIVTGIVATVILLTHKNKKKEKTLPLPGKPADTGGVPMPSLPEFTDHLPPQQTATEGIVPADNMNIVDNMIETVPGPISAPEDIPEPILLTQQQQLSYNAQRIVNNSGGNTNLEKAVDYLSQAGIDINSLPDQSPEGIVSYAIYSRAIKYLEAMNVNINTIPPDPSYEEGIMNYAQSNGFNPAAW